MDLKELIKKYWFVGLVAIALIAFTGIYVSDELKNREPVVSSKTVDSKYVAYSVDGENIFADDFYKSLYDENGINCAFIAFQRAVLDGAYETSEDMNTVASNYAAYMYQTYGQDYILDQLKAMGYVNGVDDLTQYYIDSQKRDLLMADYISLHADETITPFKKENNPRIVYHILVKVADITSSTDENGNTVYTANPTDEEKKKLNDALAALESGVSFEEVAAQYSDDSSASYGGYIGCISLANKDNYYAIFSDTSLALKDDEVSEPVVSTAGYHIIWNKGSSNEILLNDTEFVSEIENEYPTIGIKAVLDKADELGYKIVDQELKSLIDAQLQESEDAE